MYDYLIMQYSHFALVAFVRTGMVLGNQEFLLAFIARRNNWRGKLCLSIKNKEEQNEQKLLKMQKPTSQAIRKQVSEELDKQLLGQVSELVVESALRTSC